MEQLTFGFCSMQRTALFAVSLLFVGLSMLSKVTLGDSEFPNGTEVLKAFQKLSQIYLCGNTFIKVTIELSTDCSL